MSQGTAQRLLVIAPGTFVFEQGDVPAPGLGEAVVRMLVAGICGSDTHAAQGRHPFIGFPYAPGHEVVGEVVAVGDSATGEAPLRLGQRVLVEPIAGCGHCQYCTDGRYNLCANLVFFGCGASTGGMAERFLLPQRQLHPLPDRLSDLAAVLVEPLSTPVHAVELAGGDLTGRRVVIIGAGTIGLLTLAVARHRGAARIAVLDRSPVRRERSQRLGAEFVHDTASSDLISDVRADLGGSADLVVDCIARQSSLDQAVALALNGGTVVVVGVPGEPLTLPMPQIQDAQVRIQGSATYRADDIHQAIAMMAEGVVDAADFVTAQFPLTQAEAAFTAATSGREVKVVLTPGSI